MKLDDPQPLSVHERVLVRGRACAYLCVLECLRRICSFMSLCIESPFCAPLVCACLCACRILDVQPNRLSVGGVRSIEPVLHRRGQVATHDFVGCIMEFAVNGRPLEPSQALASRGILDRSALLSVRLLWAPPSLAAGHLFTLSDSLKRF